MNKEKEYSTHVHTNGMTRAAKLGHDTVQELQSHFTTCVSNYFRHLSLKPSETL